MNRRATPIEVSDELDEESDLSPKSRVPSPGILITGLSLLEYSNAFSESLRFLANPTALLITPLLEPAGVYQG
jgi:hypothetical protein